MQQAARPSSSWWQPLSLAIVAACAPFGSTATFSTDAGSSESSSGGASDAAGGPSPDGGVEAGPDAPDARCSADALILGTNVEGNDIDRVPVGSVDTYGFTSAASIASVVARCVKLYVANVTELAGGNIVAGVYSDGANKPGLLLARATLVDVKVGWNTALLDTPLSVAPSGTYWLAFTPTNGAFSVVVNGSCAQGQLPRKTRTDAKPGDLPSPFSENGGGTQCGAAVFLGP